MISIERSALVPYSCEQMFALVNDVASYPAYMPGCKAVEILSQSDTELCARLTLSKAGLSQQFATRNALAPPHQMLMRLEEGPFSHFEGAWQFQPLGELGCKVIFSLRFSLQRGLVAAAAGRLFEAVASEQVAALCRRAQQLYG